MWFKGRLDVVPAELSASASGRPKVVCSCLRSHFAGQNESQYSGSAAMFTSRRITILFLVSALGACLRDTEIPVLRQRMSRAMIRTTRTFFRKTTPLSAIRQEPFIAIHGPPSELYDCYQRIYYDSGQSTADSRFGDVLPKLIQLATTARENT